jgi:hypothetical protein
LRRKCSGLRKTGGIPFLADQLEYELAARGAADDWLWLGSLKTDPDVPPGGWTVADVLARRSRSATG